MPETTEQAEDEVRTRPFADVLATLNKGRTHTELSEKLQQLVGAVIETGKKGSITLQITVEPTKTEGLLEVSDNVTVKMPTFARAASIFFADDEFNLTRNDPNQSSLPFDVSADSSDLATRKAN
jgi:hypothetical protein